jgi:hypothetical protein
MYSDKAIRAIMANQAPKPRVTDVSQMASSLPGVTEGTGFRMSIEEINKAIEDKTALLGKDPKNDGDLRADIKELQAVKAKAETKAKVESTYMDLLNRAGKAKCNL